MKDETRLLRKIYLCRQKFWVTEEPTDIDSVVKEDTQNQIRVTSSSPLPLMTEEAAMRFSKPLRNPNLLHPILHLQWTDQRAGSSSIDSRWLRDVEVIVVTLLVVTLVSTGFSEQQTRASKVGLFAPWLRITNHLTSFFSLSQWKDHKNREENPWEQLASSLGDDWRNLSIGEVVQHVLTEPQILRSVIHIQTSITGASTTVSHSIT